MTSTPSTISASVTRILSLTGFPKELKTKDIQAAFSEFESANGGFKIKWIDDTSLYIVFQDPTVAKRAYLRMLASPPAVFTSESSNVTATIRPYDGPDAQTVIQAINARQNGGGSRRAASISVPGPRGGMPARGGHAPHASFSLAASAGREPSPTLPDLPSHPTLDALIGASLSTAAGSVGAAAPRIGDPGKRMVGHALGVRHPGLGPKANGAAPPMGGLTVAE